MKTSAGKKVSVQSSKLSAGKSKVSSNPKVKANPQTRTEELLEELISLLKPLLAVQPLMDPPPPGTGTAPPQTACQQPCCCEGAAAGTIMFCEDGVCTGLSVPTYPAVLSFNPNANNGLPFWERITP